MRFVIEHFGDEPALADRGFELVHDGAQKQLARADQLLNFGDRVVKFLRDLPDLVLAMRGG